MSLGWWSDDQRSRWKASRLNERMMSLTFNVTCAWNSSTHRPSHCACPYLWRTLVDSRHINQQTSLKSNNLDPKRVGMSFFQRPQAVQEPGQVRLHYRENWDFQASIIIYRTVEKQLRVFWSPETSLMGVKVRKSPSFGLVKPQGSRKLGNMGDLEYK